MEDADGGVCACVSSSREEIGRRLQARVWREEIGARKKKVYCGADDTRVSCASVFNSLISTRRAAMGRAVALGPAAERGMRRRAANTMGVGEAVVSESISASITVGMSTKPTRKRRAMCAENSLQFCGTHLKTPQYKPAVFCSVGN